MKNKLTIFIFALLFVWRAQAQVTATLTQPTGCEANGMIELDIKGEGPFTIDWTTLGDDGNPFNPKPVQVPHEEWNNQTKIRDLQSGVYCVTVKNAKCCEAQYCFFLESTEGSVKLKLKINPTACFSMKANRKYGRW
jgi:hypothetical protein